jgi:hypothetical protein
VEAAEEYQEKAIQKMKAITLTQPWASLMAHGVKTFETRSWKTNYRGDIAVHSAKKFPSWAKEKFYEEPFNTYMHKLGYQLPEDLLLGFVLSTHILTGCYETPRWPRNRAFYENDIVIPPPWPESAFGDYSPGRYAFRMELVEMFAMPIPFRGQLGIWNWPSMFYDGVGE